MSNHNIYMSHKWDSGNEDFTARMEAHITQLIQSTDQHEQEGQLVEDEYAIAFDFEGEPRMVYYTVRPIGLFPGLGIFVRGIYYGQTLL
jgi:hypothetical protein